MCETVVLKKWIPNTKKGKIKNFFFDILVPISLLYMYFNIVLYFFKCKSISIKVFFFDTFSLASTSKLQLMNKYQNLFALMKTIEY